MEPISIVLACTTVLSTGGMVWAFRQQSRQAAELRVLREELLSISNARAAAEASRAPLEEERDLLKDDLESLRERFSAAERDGATLREKVKQMESRRAEWEQEKTQMIDLARSGAIGVANDMFNRLMEGHKRENEEAKKQTQEITSRMFEATKILEERLKVAESQAGSASDKAEKAIRALTNPGGAGKMGEVGLENLLKSFDLKPGIDFIMQYHIAGQQGAGALRPDVVIYLPQNSAIIIDCKASQHVYAMEEALGTEAEAEAFEKFRASMQAHARALAMKDYKNAFEQDCRKSGREVSTTLSLMYIPSDGSIARLREKAPGLCDYLQKADILIVGPTMLYSVCSLAKTRLMEVQRMESAREIEQAVAQLMESVITAISHAEGMGKGLKRMFDSYNDFTKTINGRMIGRLKKLKDVGVLPTNNKQIPPRLALYDIIKHDEVLDLESEEAEGDKVIAITAG